MLEPIKLRRSIRKYQNQEVEEEKLEQLLESARLAPSGNNTQPWHFIVVKSEVNKKKLVKVSHDQQWMLTAPIFIVCVADIQVRMKNSEPMTIHEQSPQKEVKLIIRDTAVAVEHILLTATSLGLGTCWVGMFTQDEIRPTLGIPSDKYVVGIITVGYADEQPTPRPRNPLSEIIHYENW